MIPILYEKTETAFISNGLGRLRDCISCVVTEERNGIYECDFEYPMTAEDFGLIQVGRIIGVTHDDSGDIQPFDIVSYERPIEGVVKFHAVHISYRQSYLTVNGSNINSLADAFTQLGNATPTNPFTYETDKTSTGYLGCADGLPKTVRSVLGGIEGSVLDAYGGEYEWDKFRVILHSARGQYRDFAIRYGVNMVDYNEEVDMSGTYSSVIPYWTDGTDKVVGDRQDSGSSTVTGRGECVPLDVSDKFDSNQGKPTKAQVNAMGLSVMNSKTPYLPVQNIHVEFIRLQDLPEYAGFGNLMRCQLCDTIKVIFPDYNSSGQFKIVKTEWNVLTDRYDSMELGDLSMSLSEALGINNGSVGSLNFESPAYSQNANRNTADSTTTNSTTGATITSVTHTSKTGLVFVFGQAVLKTSANTTRLCIFKNGTNELSSITNSTANTTMIVAGVLTCTKDSATTFDLRHVVQSGATSTLVRYQTYRICVVDIPPCL